MFGFEYAHIPAEGAYLLAHDAVALAAQNPEIYLMGAIVGSLIPKESTGVGLGVAGLGLLAAYWGSLGGFDMYMKFVGGAILGVYAPPQQAH